MLVSVCSSKGAPGVTSTALVLAAGWPRPVVLIEADPSGGDLAFRCRSAGGGPPAATPSVLGLASAVSGASIGDITTFAQQLAGGVHLVQGVSSAAQGRGLTSLWGSIAQACVSADVDVIADLGRIDRSSATMPLAASSDRLLVACTPVLESTVHTRETLIELVGAVGPDVSGSRLVPLVIGAARHARGDRDDVDQVMAAAGVLASPAAHLPLDAPTLARLEGGESAAGRLSRTLLLRAARGVVDQISQNTVQGAHA